jgi:hypothetical protein
VACSDGVAVPVGDGVALAEGVLLVVGEATALEEGLGQLAPCSLVKTAVAVRPAFSAV